MDVKSHYSHRVRGQDDKPVVGTRPEEGNDVVIQEDQEGDLGLQ